ncbi:MAG: conjugative transposon protein TraM [Chitinophagaceae bacterium]|nr:conjugative transposon protein TraM [Chitinophagaceae bacterium]
MQQTPQQKKRKLLIAISIFLIVFAGLAYFGYQHFIKKEALPVQTSNALNSKLPEAKQPLKEMNKLELYIQAEKDSASKKEQQNNDPYSYHPAIMDPLPPDYTVQHFSLLKTTDPNEQKVNDRLDQLYKELNKAAEPPVSIPIPAITSTADTIRTPTAATTASVVDPEMKQLETMLDKLMDIQHPELVKQRSKKKDSAQKQNEVVTLSANNTIQAVVHQTQTLTNGGTIKLRLLQDIFIGTNKIPKGNFLFGVCTINNERLNVQLTNASYNNQIVPLSLYVFDMDGIEGIYIPGTISRDVTKGGADQGLQSLGMTSFDASLAAQATSAGIQTAKALLSKKVKLIRVTVKAGHHILLQNPHSF